MKMILSTLSLLLILCFSSTGFSQCSNDVTPPTAQCNSNFTTTLSPAGIAIISPIVIDSASTDNCGIANYLINNMPLDTFDCTHVGTSNPVILTVIDTAGNTATCASFVNIVDATPPTILCPPTPVNFYLGANGTVTIDPSSVATASDGCSILSWYIGSSFDTTFDCSHIGMPQTVTITAEDQSGNTAQCNAIINVLDTVAPIANCHDTVNVQLNQDGTVEVVAIALSNGSTDECSILQYTINGLLADSFNCSQVGVPTPSVLTVSDASGNTSTCISIIEIQDNLPPLVQCQDFTVTVNSNGTTTLFADSINNGSVDNCLIASTTFSNGANSINYTCGRYRNTYCYFIGH